MTNHPQTPFENLLFINGKFIRSSSSTEVCSPFNGSSISSTFLADDSHLEDALKAAWSSFLIFRKSSRFIRAKLLKSMADGIEHRRVDFVNRMVQEAGKPRLLSEAEVTRAVLTFTQASEAAKRHGGEIIPIDLDPTSRAYYPAVSMEVPRGPVLAIAPFNFPLNLIAHKVAPALAVGTSVIIKPPPQAPGCAQILAEIFLKSAQETSDTQEQIPIGVLQVVSAPNEVLSKALTDTRVSILSFTGSDQVGWMLQGKAIRKKTVLELGGNAAVVIHSDADLKRASARCAYGAFAYAGQICISVQRIFVHQAIAQEFEKLFLAEVAKLKVGDPNEKDTLVGPVIDLANCDRLLNWIKEAQNNGAQLLIGGQKNGNVITPGVLKNVPLNCKLNTEEVFGPIAILNTYSDPDLLFDVINQSRFGLQAGVFTQNLAFARKAAEQIDAGGILINEIPTFRADAAPYGGMKDSGLGREGVAYAMLEFCERKTVIEWKFF